MLKQDIQSFFKSKTNWLGLSMISGGLISVFNSLNSKTEITQNAIESILGGFALIFVRDGIAGVNNAK